MGSANLISEKVEFLNTCILYIVHCTMYIAFQIVKTFPNTAGLIWQKFWEHCSPNLSIFYTDLSAATFRNLAARNIFSSTAAMKVSALCIWAEKWPLSIDAEHLSRSENICKQKPSIPWYFSKLLFFWQSVQSVRLTLSYEKDRVQNWRRIVKCYH